MTEAVVFIDDLPLMFAPCATCGQPTTRPRTCGLCEALRDVEDEGLLRDDD